MKTTYFANCKTIEEVKKEYKRLAFLYHPDREGGNTKIMQDINNEYSILLKSGRFEFTQNDEQDFFRYKDIINDLINLNGLIIEIIGSWIWLSGNTRDNKDVIKKIGFNYASKKQMWFYHPFDYKAKYSYNMPIDKIRTIYGTKVINSKTFAEIE